MKSKLTTRLAACAFLLTTSLQLSLLGQAENRYFDGETIGTKGTYDRDADKFVSTGGVKKDCGGMDVYFAYVLTTFRQGGMPIPALYIGDHENDYVGTDVKVLEENRYYVVGYTTRAQKFPGVWDPSTGSISKYYNAFIALVDRDNPANDWIRVFGDSVTNDMATAVTVDPDGNAWVTGIANEQLPCKPGSTQNCNQDCYPVGDLLFACYDQSGNPVIDNKMALNGSTWSKGSDIYYEYNKVYMAVTISNSDCQNGYNTTAAVVSYDPVLPAYFYKYITDTTNLMASGLYRDNTGGMLMVGDIPARGNGYLWQFNANLGMMSFNEFDNYQNTWNFKSVLSDSFCYVEDDTLGNSDTVYTRLIVISGDDNSNINPLSHMFALRIDPGNLNRLVPTSDIYAQYVYNYSRNANIIPVTVPCGTDVTQTLDYGVFGRSHDSHFASRETYIATINHSLTSGCPETDSFAFYLVDKDEFNDNVLYDSLPVLDTFLQEDNGMNWQNICEEYFRPPMTGQTNNPIPDDRKADPSNMNDNIRLFPNPANQMVTIYSNTMFDHAYAEIMDISGKIVRRIDIGHAKSVDFNISKLASGIYSINVWDNGRYVRTLKMVKQD